MKINAFNIGVLRSGIPPKILLIMKLIAIIMTTFLIQVSAAGFAQKVTLKERNAELQSVLQKIRAQTGYDFLFDFSVIENAKKVSVEINNLNIDQALEELFKDQNLSYSIKDKSVVIKIKEPSFLDKVVDAFTPPVDISGLVLDEKGLPLAGVTVRVKGSGKATSTGNDGRFYLAGVDDDAVIEFRIIGYKALELPAKGKFEGIHLEPASKDLEEVVVAYGKTTQQALTGAVTVIKGEQIADLPYRSFDKSLQGLVPGLQITNGTGQPGGGVSSMVQRGISTGADAYAGSTVRNPLIVVDGVPVVQDNFQNQIGTASTPVTNPLAQLNPSDIESYTVLKDASAIALYGSKAANGVILITTKKGKAGQMVFTFRSQLDVSSLPGRNKKNIMNQDEYLGLLYDSYRNSNPTQWNDAAIRKDLYSKFPYKVSGTDTTFYTAPDLSSELFQNGAPTVSNELSMSGGNEKSNYYINFEYTKQEGIVRETGYDRKSFRINFENKPVHWLTLGTKTLLSYNVSRYANQTETELGFGILQTFSPLNPLKDSRGDYILSYRWGGSGTNTLNPRAVLEYNTYKSAAFRGLTKLYAEVEFLKYFRFNSSLGVDFMLAETLDKTDPRFRVGSSNIGAILDKDTRTANVIASNLLTVNIPLPKRHETTVLLGQEAQILTGRAINGEVKADINALPIFDQLTSPGYVLSSVYGINTRQTMLSYFGQLNYGFDNKYFISASIRKDGSSRFGARELWGTYWSLGAGWVLTGERALAAILDDVNYFKIRGSIGAAGNSGAVNPTTKYDVLRQGIYDGATSITSGTDPGNPYIKWERTFSWNVGLDARFLNNRIGVTADVYNKKTKDLIYPMNLPAVTGFGQVRTNIGNMANKGFELTVSGEIFRKTELRWNTSATLSANSNKLVKANVSGATLLLSNLANEEGREFNSFYLRKWLGVNPDDGKPLWEDSSGNETSVYNQALQQFVGNPQPDGFGALNNRLYYKGFELNVQVYFQYGNKVMYDRMSILTNDGSIPYVNQSRLALDYWKKPGDISANPRRILNSTDGGRNASTRFLYDGDYIKLSNVMLAYTFPKQAISTVMLKQLRVFIQVNNLATWTKLPDQDPDNANLAGGITSPYPNARTFSAGLQANF